jgi:hypothetical protein
VHELALGLDDGRERAGDVFDVHERAPRRAVALEEDLPRRVRVRDQVVDHEVETDARRPAERGGAAHELNTNRRTPASRAISARRTVARWLISSVSCAS